MDDVSQKQENILHKSVLKFQEFAKNNYPDITEDSDNGEWEIGIAEFDGMIDQILKTIQNVPYNDASDQMLDDILYGIARDNECGMIIDYLEDFPEWYSVLCRKSLGTGYTNAKWQFAESLRNYKGHDGLQDIIFQFLDTGDEYTERLALKTLADLFPERAEEFAIEFWNREKFINHKGYEYQKIMALHVLFEIHSSKLNEYLELAEKSDFKWLRLNAGEIRQKEHDSRIKTKMSLT